VKKTAASTRAILVPKHCHIHYLFPFGETEDDLMPAFEGWRPFVL
jgi:hypothetical protein